MAGYARARLRGAIAEHMPEEGIRRIFSDDVFIARRNRAGISEHRFDRPLASFMAQGAKTTVIGTREYEVSENQILTVGIDMPSSSHIMHASAEKPLLTVFFYINPAIISELLLELGHNRRDHNSAMNGVLVADAREDFIETLARLLSLLDEPLQDGILSRMIIRELHYLLLRGPQGALLQSLYGKGVAGRQFHRAIDYLKKHLDRPVRIIELAEAACMSESSLYRHFKSVTGLSPLQYHKQLRLHEARRIMLVENERAANAAFRVGFESIPQFSREYKRLFGQPPHKDTRRG